MKFKVAFLTLFLTVCFSPLAAQTCPRGHARSLAYIFRDGNRCEGFRDRTASGPPELIAFYTSSLGQDYPDSINIRVPGTDNIPPTIEVESYFRNYRLDNLATRRGAAGFTFSLNSYVLKEGRVPLRSLNAVAYILRNSSPVYYPVILEEPTGRYEFVMYTPLYTTFPTFEIRRDGRTVYSEPKNNPQRRQQVKLTWAYANAPAGSYELYITDGEGQSLTFPFVHNPSWY